MEIFWRLILGHLIADFTLQTNAIAEWKKQSAWGLTVHCATHLLAYLALTFPFLSQPWFFWGTRGFSGWFCICALTLSHFLADAFKIWSIRKNPAYDNTIFYLFDQMLHLTFLVLFSPP